MILDWLVLTALPVLGPILVFFLLQVVEGRTARLSPVQRDGQHFVGVALSQRLFFYISALAMLSLFSMTLAAWKFKWGTPDVELKLVLALGLLTLPVAYSSLWVGTRRYSWNEEVARTRTDVTLTRKFHWSNLVSIAEHKSKLGSTLDFGDDGQLRVKLNSLGAAMLIQHGKSLLARRLPVENEAQQ